MESERERRLWNMQFACCQPDRDTLRLPFPPPQLQTDWKCSSLDRPLHKKKCCSVTQASSCGSWQLLASVPSNAVDLRSSKSQREGNSLGGRRLHNWQSTSPFLIKNNKITSSIEGWIPVADPLRMSSLSLNVSLHKPWKLIHVKCLSKINLLSSKHLKFQSCLENCKKTKKY